MASWVIIVDDDITNLKVAGQILSKNNMRVTALKSGGSLLEYVRENGAPDLILLDINMPEMDGFETLSKFRELEDEKGIAATPIVFLTADEDFANESKGFEMGVSDYIRKPFNPDVLVRRVENIVSTHGQMLKFEEEATIDKLTGFLNKYSANEQISEMCRTKSGALMIIDLDSFKLVNDIYGHDMGDRVLSAFSRILKDNMYYPSVFGRIGGDEFLLFAENMKEEKDISKFSDAINRNLILEARKMMGEDMSIPLGASIGAIFVPEQGTDYNILFRLTDRALYTIKNNGKHGYSLYMEEDAANSIPTDITLAMLTTILEERNIPQNAMWMGKEAFGNVYRYMIRYMDRYRGTAYKMLFSAKFIPNDLSESEKEKIMVSLRELLQESLRNSDIMMQIGENHFFLMLPEISDYNVNRVTERVMHSWRNNEYSGLVRLEVETESTDAELHENYIEKDDGETHIVIADDNRDDLDFMKSVLKSKGYDVIATQSGQELLDYLAENRPDLMILKVDMKGMNGFETIIKIRKQGGALRKCPVMFIAGEDPAVEKRGLELGAADFLRMPISAEKLYLRVSNVLKLFFLENHMNQEVEKKTEENEKLSIHIIQALAYAIDAKDNYTNGHSSRVAEYSKEIAARYGFNEEQQNDIYITGLLHDVGKIGIPDAIINKRAKLTEEEYDVIKKHPVIGTQILETIKEMPELSSGARWHHERYDGKGYPDGFAGTDIPEVARIIAVADSYDAMTSDRSYREPLSQSEARAEIDRCSGTQFDPVFAGIMIDLIDEDKDFQMREHK
ncbi:MAG: response regulator [Lachnospiraceae bacterium]|nr:response regulator [Lachnospiraceae bacterium]